MVLSKKIKKELEKGTCTISLKSQISDEGISYAELNMSLLSGANISLETPIVDTKFRFQPLILGANGFSKTPYRMDNCHGKLHQHFSGAQHLTDVKTVGEVFVMLLGRDYKDLDPKWEMKSINEI